MIAFKTISWKNFLSTGNVFTKIDLCKHSTTLIVGENGAGKSTILDALTFALFGKPYRNINKPQLINSINNKDCLVELEFTVSNKKYLIRRGIKPNVFEILVDGQLLNQDAKSKDYQDMLEKTILKMNYKSFTQIVILGAASFTPFMQLSAADRRAVIEDLLDIQIFTNMNVVVKDKVALLKTQISENKIKLDSVKEKIDLHKKHIEEMKRNTDDMIQKKRESILEQERSLAILEDEKARYEDQINNLQTEITDFSTVTSKKDKLLGFEAKFENNKQKLQKDVTFYSSNDNCPTCMQVIDPTFKESVIHKCSEQIHELDTGLSKLQEQKNALLHRISAIQETNKKIADLETNLTTSITSIQHTKRYLRTLQAEVDDLSDQKVVSGDTKAQSEVLLEELTNLVEERKSATEQRHYYDAAAQLLKDGGIKSRIIKQYLPVINKLVNKYLSSMDFFVNFNIDEEFKETIKSRHRDDFSYQSFSEGEKQKIDLSLLLTWRSIARMKNSVNTNLLILDETFDSSLDMKGTDNLLQILHALPDNTNVFVISHKDQLHDKFHHSMKFEKKQGFSRVV